MPPFCEFHMRELEGDVCPECKVMEQRAAEWQKAIAAYVPPPEDAKAIFIRNLWNTIIIQDGMLTDKEFNARHCVYSLHGDIYIYSQNQEGYNTRFIDSRRIM